MKQLIIAALLATRALALPTGGTPAAGSVQIENGPGGMQITQGSSRAIVNWSSFDIGSRELVRFVQPGPFAAILNRVGGGDPSLILGTMTANGQVFLVNPNGIVFGKGATVDVGSLLATTLTMRDQDFLSGHYLLAQDPARELAAVLNQGTLKVDANGFVVLAAPQVSNEGLILANLGQVALIEGTRATVSFDPEGLVQYEVQASGQGPVAVTRGAVDEVLAGVVRHPGQREAGSIHRKADGQICLEPDDPEDVQLADLLGQPLTRANVEAILAMVGEDLRVLNNIFLGNLDYGEPPGGFSASDLADYPTGLNLLNDESWLKSELFYWQDQDP